MKEYLARMVVAKVANCFSFLVRKNLIAIYLGAERDVANNGQWNGDYDVIKLLSEFCC